MTDFQSEYHDRESKLPLYKVTPRPNSVVIARDVNGMGWCRFAGGAALRCDGCGTLTREGYIARSGWFRRCVNCVELR